MEYSENIRVSYQAIFINPEDVRTLIEKQGEKLPKVVKEMHCTFKFQPSKEEIEKFSELLGKDLTLKVVGYCSDGKNSGYEVELTPEQDKFYTNSHNIDGEIVPVVERTTPHITVSMKEGAKAVDTGMLPFSREGFEPFIIHGKAGLFTSRIIGKDKISKVVYEPLFVKNEDKEDKEVSKTQEQK